MRLRLITGLAAALAAVALAPGAAATAPVPCAGTVVIVPAGTPDVRVAGGETFVSFDFTGWHDVCLADGSSVVATVTGHIVQRTSADGDLSLRFVETVSHGGSSIDFRGEATLSGTNWQSHVQTVGAGTGLFAGMSGQGSFWPTATPGVLTDVIHYVYR